MIISVNPGPLRLGEGLPKICVPLSGENMPALLEEAARAVVLPADLFEWRMDGFFGSFTQALAALGQTLGEKHLLCTMRRREEGGKAELSDGAYEAFLTALLEQGGFSLVDIELSAGQERVRRLTDLARSRGILSVVSRHDFQGTPSREEMLSSLRQAKALGGDVPKLAVMPKREEDVLALLEVSLQTSRELGPVITMSMGDLGRLSRVAGQLSGSCVTFGAGKEASAPGQLNAEDLRAILEDLKY